MSYSVELTDNAVQDREKLSQVIAERIDRKINWLAENFKQITPQALTANLAGLFKLRMGDYRVIYSFNAELKLITVHKIGHRREIYDI
ncbi:MULTISPECIES: type II toxin-antitoxin system RelE/ParE family toxin [Spirulina sp. CCY15215]|uniref:type II toxin-antitoxin system RelE family toxin n=1 Tax=Spirulina sp. CCY15215 TaxID=2767591 RepID=UPI00194FCBDD|nr:type II toxin-antitoxin system RelE/ParE family toxin [Spirulina major]